ncbi:ECF transporter S component [Pediococcus cellicola]|uniref:Integral membrane protein n=1 Tax=Pediococcus cellicola TaxID=319652 RepID=A0A0R2IQ16_9LACO|nr:ECF transporter S component [Pediococcus cellicola]KRN67282.1 integral membrane protein [Pediococcus cellicola]GEL14926.1 membrane protein [Pediococcus cellicola]
MHNNQLRKIVITALFAAIIFIGISVFQIPIPAMIGRPFVHFGNALTALAILFLGFGYGTLAGAIGLGLFDVTHGYVSTVYLTIIEVIIVAAVVTWVFKLLRRDDTKKWHIVLVAFVAGLTKIFTSFGNSLIEGVFYQGMQWHAAFIGALASEPATVVNSITTFILVIILYYPLKKILGHSGLQ